MTALLALAAGLVIGLVLGALGGGGSILAVPVLVYLFGLDPHAATTTSLVIVGTTAVSGALAHHRAGRVRWREGLTFGALGAVGAVVGSALSAGIDADVLLLAFALLMLVVAVSMILRARRQPPSPRASSPVPSSPAPSTTRDGGRATHALRLVAAATGVGLLTGFLGVGGGFVVVPALVLTLGFAMPAAVGTSLVVIAVNSAVALTTRLGGAPSLDWAVVIPFTAAAVAAALGGTRLAGVLRPATLATAFSALLLAVAVSVGVQAATSLV